MPSPESTRLIMPLGAGAYRLEAGPCNFKKTAELAKRPLDSVKGSDLLVFGAIVHVSTSQGSLCLDGGLQRLGLLEKQLSASVALSFEGFWPESGPGKASPVSTLRRAPRFSAELSLSPPLSSMKKQNRVGKCAAEIQTENS
jgi:hypothetical protein